MASSGTVWRRTASIAAVLIAAGVAFPLRAQTTLYCETGPEYLDEQTFASVEPGFSYESASLAAHLGVPLRLRLNRSLAARNGVLRAEDWDDLSDAGRIVRQVDLQVAERTFTLRLGPLAHARSGHGTIVNGLVGSLDPDSLPLGAQARVVAGAFALDALGADVFAPGIVGGTATLEPLSLWGEANDRVHLAASLFADPSAPAAQGSPRALVYGAGIDVALSRSRSARIAPYLDANVRGPGFGLHAGLLADLLLGPAELSLKAEWRRAFGPYLPDYFDVGYPAERYAYSAGAFLPKADAVLDIFNSWRAEARLLAGPLTAGASLSGRGQGLWDASAVIDLGIGDLDLAAFAALRAFEWGHNPEQVYLLAEARYRLGSFVYLWSMGGRLYRLESFASGGAAEPTVQAAVGLGLAAVP